MKIFIDDGLVTKERKGGIGHFAFYLTAHLKQISDCDFSEYYFLNKLPRYIKRWAYIGMSNISRVNYKYDIIHHMSYYSPFNKGNAKHVLTVYDLSILRYPQTISLAWRHYNRFSLKKSINRCDAIITISQAIKEELISVFPGIRKEKVFSCPVGLNPEYLQFQPKEELLTSMSIEPFSYFLFVGDLTKRKNLPFLLRNFLLAKQKGMINQSTKIILVGKRAWGYYEISPFLKKEEGIIELGYLSPEMIITLYKY
jgi:glycosyltransferase involved in cell wall biosynthesis